MSNVCDMGRSSPLGVAVVDDGVNFSLFNPF